MGDKGLEDVMGANAAQGIELFMDALRWMNSDKPYGTADGRSYALEAACAFAKAGEPVAVAMCAALAEEAGGGAAWRKRFDPLLAQARERRGKEASGE